MTVLRVLAVRVFRQVLWNVVHRLGATWWLKSGKPVRIWAGGIGTGLRPTGAAGATDSGRQR